MSTVAPKPHEHFLGGDELSKRVLDDDKHLEYALGVVGALGYDKPLKLFLGEDLPSASAHMEQQRNALQTESQSVKVQSLRYNIFYPLSLTSKTVSQC